VYRHRLRGEHLPNMSELTKAKGQEWGWYFGGVWQLFKSAKYSLSYIIVESQPSLHNSYTLLPIFHSIKQESGSKSRVNVM